MKKLDKSQYLNFNTRISSTKKKRMSTLDKYLKEDWINLADTQQTYNRLRRKGNPKAASELLEVVSKKKKTTRRRGIQPESTTGETAESSSDRMNRTVYEAIIGTSQIMPVNFLHEGSHRARSVGRIISFPDRLANGTGFLVSPSLILTNNHVLPTEDQAENNRVQFDFFADESGRRIDPVEFRFQPDVFFLTSQVDEFDFTLVAVEPVNASGQHVERFGWNRLIAETGKAQEGERLNIVHHPEGQPQQISIRNNFVVDLQEQPKYIYYMADTMPGSSGSPVFNEEWEVVALHHAATEIQDPKEKAMFMKALHGFDPKSEEQLKNRDVSVNEGIRISRIVNHVLARRDGFDDRQQELIDQMLYADPVVISDSPFIESNESRNTKLMKTSSSRSGNPVNININIGTDGGVNISEKSLDSKKGASTISDHRQLEIYKNQLNSSKSVFKALAFLQNARERSYLPPPDVVSEIRDGYYGDLSSRVDSGMNEADLYDELNSLLDSTLDLVDTFPEELSHLESLITKDLEKNLEGGVQYAKARAHLYTSVDLQENRMLKCVYTNLIIAPEQLLLKDLISELDLAAELPRRYKNNQFLNCEHIVPQSLFNKEKRGVSDLHHLITAEGATNTFRSNSPYRKLGSSGNPGPKNIPDYISKGGLKNQSKTFFEPLNGKGVVARASLYFFVAHKDRIQKSAYPVSAIEELKKWSDDHPPQNYELHRNERIFEVQGNRNPFIDFPGWVHKVDFLRGLKT